MLGKFIFVERCRGCRAFIKYGASGNSTVCAVCWDGIAAEPPILDHCYVSAHTLESILVASGTKYDGLVKTLVYKLKYDNDVLIARDLAGLLEIAWHEVEHLVDGDPVLVPIPLHWWRLVKRGYNQADLLSEHLSKATGQRIDRKLLSRAKATKAHHGLKRAERIVNIQGAFAANHTRAPGKCVLLVDDIYTSGATLAEAAQSLLNAGCHQVMALTVARATLSDVREGNIGSFSDRKLRAV